MFLPAALIEAATDRGVTVKRPDPQVKYVAAVDASAGGEDAFAMAICRLDGDRVEQVYGQAWKRAASGGINLEQTVDQCPPRTSSTSVRLQLSSSPARPSFARFLRVLHERR